MTPLSLLNKARRFARYMKPLLVNMYHVFTQYMNSIKYFGHGKINFHRFYFFAGQKFLKPYPERASIRVGMSETSALLKMNHRERVAFV